MDTFSSTNHQTLKRQPRLKSPIVLRQIEDHAFNAAYPPLSKREIAEARVGLLSYGISVGDVRFLLNWLKDEIPRHEHHLSEKDGIKILEAQLTLAKLIQIENRHGPGAALNLEHPYIRAMASQGVLESRYSNEEIENARRYRSLGATP
ncbi:hypothetical protein [Rhizobium sp. LCM 4573]|uniref:hypothetical protein n=1 Tax=Rhizobium sp. LCM 4573 TaxID=1848291 RepID=UPI0008D99F4D|nr:hypothetical protein [Rhizobium sp. LCM 4573]OHV82626.1 hypothetical protein LCM4573_16655 [Rhizobium sp. LCM 4573]